MTSPPRHKGKFIPQWAVTREAVETGFSQVRRRHEELQASVNGLAMLVVGHEDTKGLVQLTEENGSDIATLRSRVGSIGWQIGAQLFCFAIALAALYLSLKANGYLLHFLPGSVP